MDSPYRKIYTIRHFLAKKEDIATYKGYMS